MRLPKVIASCSRLTALFAFFATGDKGPPEWDYGSVDDVPARSIYSTYPFSEGAGAPEPQHVDKKPSEEPTGIPESRVPSNSRKETGKEQLR
jgi:hypothetical protein